MRSFNWGPLPPFVYTDVIHVVKCSQAFPLCVCILQVVKNWTVGRPRNEAMFCSMGLRQGDRTSSYAKVGQWKLANRSDNWSDLQVTINKKADKFSLRVIQGMPVITFLYSVLTK